MNDHVNAYLTLLPQFLILLPAAALCYLPMKNRLRFSWKKTMALCLLFFLPHAAIGAGICLVWKLDMNTVLIPSMVLFFLFYRRSVSVEFSCCLSVFVGVCTLMTFPAQFAYGFDAWLYPTSGAAAFSLPGAMFQFGLSCLLAGALAVPCWKVYTRLVEQLSDSWVWFPLLAVHGFLFLFNLLMIPHSYSNLYVGRMFPMFLSLEAVMLTLFLLLHVIFYHIADVVLKHAELIQRSHLLEMQAEQYQTLQNHIRQTKRLRHDFRQSVHILAALAEKGDLSGLRAHLSQYEQSLDAETTVNFCANAALNALFLYYKSMADAQGIKTLWQISLPEPLTVAELDLASLLGNLMENAIAGCATAPEGERRFALSVEVRQENCLYIVSTNSFDGKPRKNGSRYLSTKRAGEGLGLLSISSVAEKYQGRALISHKGTDFFVDVMLRI